MNVQKDDITPMIDQPPVGDLNEASINEAEEAVAGIIDTLAKKHDAHVVNNVKKDLLLSEE